MLLSYRYFRITGLIQLIVAIFLVALLSSYVTLISSGVREALPACVGAHEGIYVVYNPESLALFTGLVPEDIAAELPSIRGIEAVSPEVLVPAIVNNGYVAFLRGIEPHGFTGVEQDIEILSGRWLSGNCLEAMVGERLAGKLGIHLGSTIVVASSMTHSMMAFRVVGIVGKGPYSDEVLVNLEAGQILRGARDYVSFIRVRGQENAVKELQGMGITEEAGGKTSGGKSLPSLPTWILNYIASGKLRLGSQKVVIRDYMDVYGLSRSSIIALASIVVFTGILIVFLTSSAFIASIREEVAILLALGASRKAIWTDLSLRISPLAAMAALAGSLLSEAVVKLFDISLLFHKLSLSQQNYYFVAVLVSALTLSSIASFVFSLGGLSADEVK